MSRLGRNEVNVKQGFPTCGTCTPRVHLPIRRGTFKKRTRPKCKR